MAEITIKKKKGPSRQTALLIVFALVVLGGGGYYAITTFAPAVESVVDREAKRQLQIRRIDWQRTVYEHDTLKNLRNPLPGPLEVGTVGNPSPFRVPTLQ